MQPKLEMPRQSARNSPHPLATSRSTSSLSSTPSPSPRSNQSKRASPYPLRPQRPQARSSLRTPPKSPFGLCTLPLEKCQEMTVEICSGECLAPPDCDGPYSNCAEEVCTSSNCEDLAGNDPCSSPCSSACDFMDWLQCDGTNCTGDGADPTCCRCNSNPPQTSDGNITNALLSHQDLSYQTLFPLTFPPFDSLGSFSTTPHSQLTYVNPSAIPQLLNQPTSFNHSFFSAPASTPPTLYQVNNSSGIAASRLPPLGAQQPTTQTQDSAVCLWGACRNTFKSHLELVAHVNYDHLGVPRSSQQGPPSSLSCLWADCQQQQSNTLTDVDFQSLNELAQHLLQEHLGLSTEPLLTHPNLSMMGANFTIPQTVQEDVIPSQLHAISRHVSGPAPRRLSTSAATPLALAAPNSSSATPDSDALASIACQWTGCSQTFPSLEALSTHVEEHVGSGKGEYDCGWIGCDRHGARAFSSKQKILRHIQSHTGHRPFQCSMCDQHFSEAATLQQHMRRHTSEKPYVCDYPDCSKCFAVAGALTIHKRTHSGQKPFKCTFCDRAFSESSNLSKHLRTHTGEKPYPCPEPGCGKKFCRPDQLNRHKTVHIKRALKDQHVTGETEVAQPAREDSTSDGIEEDTESGDAAIG